MSISKEERRIRMEEELQELEEKLHSLEIKQPDFGSDVDGFDEETDEAEGLAGQLGKEQLLKEKIRQIQQDLAELEKEE
jgi:hypothetical protein